MPSKCFGLLLPGLLRMIFLTSVGCTGATLPVATLPAERIFYNSTQFEPTLSKQSEFFQISRNQVVLVCVLFGLAFVALLMGIIFYVVACRKKNAHQKSKQGALQATRGLRHINNKVLGSGLHNLGKSPKSHEVVGITSIKFKTSQQQSETPVQTTKSKVKGPRVPVSQDTWHNIPISTDIQPPVLFFRPLSEDERLSGSLSREFQTAF